MARSERIPPIGAARGMVALCAVIALATAAGCGGGTSSDERAACAAVKDYRDSTFAHAILDQQAQDIRRAGQLANRTDNERLQRLIQTARVSLADVIAKAKVPGALLSPESLRSPGITFAVPGAQAAAGAYKTALDVSADAEVAVLRYCKQLTE